MLRKIYYIDHNYNDEFTPFPVYSLKEAWDLTKDNDVHFILCARWEYVQDNIKKENSETDNLPF